MTREKVYKVQWLNNKATTPAITLWRQSDYFVYDWSTYGFVKDNPGKSCFPLFLHQNYTPPGDTQLWTLTFDTSRFADGWYFLTYSNTDGSIYSGFYQEYIYIYQGSPDPLIPNQSG